MPEERLTVVSAIKLVQSIAAQRGRMPPSDEAANELLWEHTGWPAFYNTTDDILRQVQEYYDKWLEWEMNAHLRIPQQGRFEMLRDTNEPDDP